MGKAMAISETSDVVVCELEFTKEQIRQLIDVLPGRHPLVSDLKKQLKQVYATETEKQYNYQSEKVAKKLTYLEEKISVSSRESLLSKALSLLNMGVELEEKGYVIQAVKRRPFFSKEVIKFSILGRS